MVEQLAEPFNPDMEIDPEIERAVQELADEVSLPWFLQEQAS